MHCLDHAVPKPLCSARCRSDQRARILNFCRARRKASIGNVDLVRVDKSLPVKPQRPTVRTVRGKSIRISKIVEHTIERPDTGGTRRKHDKLERKAHAVPIGGIRQVQRIGQIIGPRNQPGDTICSTNLRCTEHAQRRFDHCQQRFPDARRNCSSRIGIFDLWHNEQVARRGRHCCHVIFMPGRFRAIDTDRCQFSGEAGTDCFKGRLARGILVFGSYRIFKIENDEVFGQSPRLFDRPRI